MNFLALVEAFGLPTNNSAHGVLIDIMLNFVHWVMVVLFVGWGSFLLYVLWRYNQKRSPKADYFGARTHLSTHLEIGVIVTEVMLLLAFAFPIWKSRAGAPEMPLPEENPVYVRCVGEQFFWTFHYPGKDGVFGTINSEHFSGTNAVGLDPNDPAGKDDIVVRNTMTIPVKRPVVVQVTSKDVIHNYALHPMRIAQDAIPGLEIPTWYTPIEEGSFEIVCGQLCGAGHYAMRGFVEVVPQADFETWLEEQHATTAAGRAEQEQTAAASETSDKQQS